MAYTYLSPLVMNVDQHMQPTSRNNLRELSERFHDNPFHYRPLPTYHDRETQAEVEYENNKDSMDVRSGLLCKVLPWNFNIDPTDHSKRCIASDDNIQYIVDKAAEEILTVGRNLKQADDARKMSIDLRELKQKNDERSITEFCVKLYTRSGFLFGACNRDLRNDYSLFEGDLSSYRNLLQLYFDRHANSYYGTVYRGVTFDDAQLKLHLASDSDTVWYSPTYLSTSKCRQVAELFGAALMVIDIQSTDDEGKKAVDISQISAIPDEEEVLLTPEYKLYRQKRTEFDPNVGKYIIYLTSKPPVSNLFRENNALVSHRHGRQKSE